MSHDGRMKRGAEYAEKGIVNDESRYYYEHSKPVEKPKGKKK